MRSFKTTTLTLLLILSICVSCGQTEKNNYDSDEPKILKSINPLNYLNQNVETLKLPERKYDSPFFCDEIIDYNKGFIINSITSYPTGRKVAVEFNTKFFYYNPIDKSIKKISIFKADTIEAIVCSEKTLYCSYIKNGKRDIGYFKDNQYESLIYKASTDIRKYLDSAKWIKLGIENCRLFILSPNYLFELSNKNWEILTTYSLDDFYIKKLKYRRSISMLPTKNIVIKNNSVYFLQEVLQQRTCDLLKINIADGKVESYFNSLNYVDDYLKQINDFTFIGDSSLLVSASRLINKQMLINTIDDKINVWSFNDTITTTNGTKVELPVSTALGFGDTLILSSKKGLCLKYSNNIQPLVYFDNYHQSIKETNDVFDFNFEPRSIKKISNNIFLIGGMWGGLYQVDILKSKLICLDDIDNDKIQVVDLSKL